MCDKFFLRLRHGPEVNITFIVDILPKIIIDFLPPMEVLQTVVTDFVSPHQSRPRLSASIMAEVCLVSSSVKLVLSLGIFRPLHFSSRMDIKQYLLSGYCYLWIVLCSSKQRVCVSI